MKKQTKKLTLNKETLRDLMAKNAGEVKGGAPSNGKKCVSHGGTCGGYTCNTYLVCTVGCYNTYAYQCSGYACW